MGKSIRELQTSLPWTMKRPRDWRAPFLPYKDFAHACHRASKALGQLHGLVDELDNDSELTATPALRERYAKFVGDLVVCALRMASTFPSGMLDLEKVVTERIESKNGVTLRRAVELANSITQTGNGAGI